METEEPQGKALFSLRLDDLNLKHAQLSVYNRGGLAGTLCIDATDLDILTHRLADSGTFAFGEGVNKSWPHNRENDNAR